MRSPAHSAATPAAQLEAVDRSYALDVGAERPLIAHALIGHDERSSMRLLDHGHGREVVAERLVDEALSIAVEGKACSK